MSGLIQFFERNYLSSPGTHDNGSKLTYKIYAGKSSDHFAWSDDLLDAINETDEADNQDRNATIFV